jgi:hypothetical protein
LQWHFYSLNDAASLNHHHSPSLYVNDLKNLLTTVETVVSIRLKGYSEYFRFCLLEPCETIIKILVHIEFKIKSHVIQSLLF